MFGLPKSFAFLAALLALLALQVFPIVGILLMIFMAPLVCGLLVHAFLLGLLFEGLSGRTARGWIAIPLIAYGGYYAMYAAESYAIARKSAQLRAGNHAKVFAFDPDRHSLVMTQGYQFVIGHDVAVVYEANSNFRPELHVSNRLIQRDQCNLRRDSQTRITISGVHLDGVFQTSVCELQFPEAPPHQIVHAIRSGDDDIWRYKHGISEQKTEIVVDGSVIATYRTASTWRLPKLPLMMISCGLVGSGPAWKCMADFIRQHETIEDAPNGVDRASYDSPVSVMLGLRKYTAADLAAFRDHPQSASALVAVAGEPARVEDEVFGVLQQVLDGESPRPPRDMGYAIALNPQRLAPLADAMAKRFAALSHAPPNQPHRQAYVNALASGLAALPRAAFARVGDEVLALVQPKFVDYYPALYIRAADAGPQAFDFYKAILLASREKHSLRPLVPLAFCRLGRGDAEVLAELKRQFLEEKHRAKDEVFVALVKLREQAFVRDNLNALPSRLHGWANAILAGEADTETGPNNCMGESWGFTSYLPREMRPALRSYGRVWKRDTES